MTNADTEEILLSLGEEVEKVVHKVMEGKKNIEAGVHHNYIVEKGLFSISKAVNGMAFNIESSNKEITNYLSQVNSAAISQKQSLEKITGVGEILKKAALMLEESSSRIKSNEEGLASFKELTPLVNRLKNVLLESAAKEKIRSMSVDNHRDVILDIINNHKELEVVWSNRADGSFVISEPPAGLANAKVRQWWQRSMAGENYVSEIYISSITRKPCLTLSVPIRSKDGSIIGVLGSDIRLKT
ncbi:PDC sensor domain-containing protein [Candidatus Contubernalis alkaliaceticus]|uniref:PDC sensor domain-containing protein n=1 Tax=Candidatus Contubernalis alkaliaceticus TaxID=338645 RepID=UPI001F4C145E|nr:PDC sensor domain-containing protein [Candidatus Contubernalis alkalaceticus]UNC92031.1 hypothetical protein HUE98_07935 [Candidatus Contubernalis alkalaceticus]